MNAAILICLAVICLAIAHEEKFVAFEDWCADRIGYIAAKVYLSVKKARINRLVKSTDRLAKRVSK
jgi:hypothetical protein